MKQIKTAFSYITEYVDYTSSIMQTIRNRPYVQQKKRHI